MGNRTSVTSHDRTDVMLEEAFESAFGNIRASDELKAATLSMIFAETDGRAGSTTQADELVSKVTDDPANARDDVPTSPNLTVIRGGSGKAEAAADKTMPGRPARHRRLPGGGWLVRAAAAVAAMAVVTGGVAYAVPSSHVMVSQDDMSVDLGVNIFGMAVTADTDDARMRELINRGQVCHVGYETALGRVLDAYDSLSGSSSESEPTIEADSPFDMQRDDLGKRAESVVSNRKSRANRQSGTTEPSASTPATASSPTGTKGGVGDAGDAQAHDAGTMANPAGGNEPSGTSQGTTGVPGSAGSANGTEGTGDSGSPEGQGGQQGIGMGILGGSQGTGQGGSGMVGGTAVQQGGDRGAEGSGIPLNANRTTGDAGGGIATFPNRNDMRAQGETEDNGYRADEKDRGAVDSANQGNDLPPSVAWSGRGDGTGR